MKQLIIFLVLAALFAACSPAPAGQTAANAKSEEAARQTLEQFFSLLSKGQYDQAAGYYASALDTLVEMNPNLDPGDKTALWKAACEVNGFQCKLSLRSATVKEQSGDTIRFTFEFNNPDGSLFVLGPCCGATETEQPPVSQFEFLLTWRPDENRYVVMNLPPYVP